MQEGTRGLQGRDCVLWMHVLGKLIQWFDAVSGRFVSTGGTPFLAQSAREVAWDAASRLSSCALSMAVLHARDEPSPSQLSARVTCVCTSTSCMLPREGSNVPRFPNMQHGGSSGGGAPLTVPPAPLSVPSGAPDCGGCGVHHCVGLLAHLRKGQLVVSAGVQSSLWHTAGVWSACCMP